MDKTKILEFKVKDTERVAFAKWQAELHAQISEAVGFESLEILSPSSEKELWTITYTFDSQEHAAAWIPLWQELERSLTPLLDSSLNIQEKSTSAGVTEVILVHVNPSQEALFKAWMGKIHQVEAAFAGFKGVYVQAPKEGNQWITLLQFDSQEHLDAWLSSKERSQILKEGEALIQSLETHRVVSAFSGWFTGQEGSPPAWKQTCLVLLVLYPIVMLEMHYFNPLLSALPFPLVTFFSNALSVTLISWPFLPIAIYLLGWWLHPKTRYPVLGLLLLLFLYFVEIAWFVHASGTGP